MTEPIEEPFQLANSTPRPKRKRAKFRISKADLELLALYIHREDFTRQELAKKFCLTLKQLQAIIRQKGWLCKEGEDESENDLPLPSPDPTVFVPCPYKAGSEGKIWMLEERYARRLPLWHEKDNPRKVRQRSEDPLQGKAPA